MDVICKWTLIEEKSKKNHLASFIDVKEHEENTLKFKQRRRLKPSLCGTIYKPKSHQSVWHR